MRKEASTSLQRYYDPWLLAARNASPLGFTYSGGKMTLAKHILPYIYANGNVGTSYRANDIIHEELVEELRKAPYRWLLSEYEHPVYARFGRPFCRKEVQLRTTNFRDDGGKGRRVECLWRNYYNNRIAEARTGLG
jgi:hypothetical protein